MPAGRKAGTPANNYALGALLFALGTGRAPCQGTPGQALAQVLTEPPPAPSSLRHGLPKAMEAVIHRAMERAPARRFPDAPAFLAALEPQTEEFRAPPKRWPTWPLIVLGAALIAAMLVPWPRKAPPPEKPPSDGGLPPLVIRPEPMPLDDGGALSPEAQAGRPAVLPGVLGWTVETRSPRGGVRLLAFSPDDKWLGADCQDGTVRVYEAAGWRLHRILVPRSPLLGEIEAAVEQGVALGAGVAGEDADLASVHPVPGRVRDGFTLPPALRNCGASPSHEQERFTLGHSGMSVPISLASTSTRAVASSIPSMPVRSSPATSPSAFRASKRGSLGLRPVSRRLSGRSSAPGRRIFPSCRATLASMASSRSWRDRRSCHARLSADRRSSRPTAQAGGLHGRRGDLVLVEEGEDLAQPLGAGGELAHQGWVVQAGADPMGLVADVDAAGAGMLDGHGDAVGLLLLDGLGLLGGPSSSWAGRRL